MKILRDLRLALRSITRSPGYAAPILLTFALTIGATSAIFSAVYAVLLKPLPIRQPSQLVVGWETDPAQHLSVVELSYRLYERWASASQSFSHLAAMGSSVWPSVLKGRGEPIRLSAVGVSANFFDTLGTAPALGRTFTPDDDLPNAAPVVALSHGLWMSRFGGDTGIVGTRIVLDDETATVAGVMPPGFDFPRGTDFWMPVVPVLVKAGADWQTSALESVGVLFYVGRLRDGVSPRLAGDDLARLTGDLRATVGVTRPVQIVATPLLEYWFGPIRQALWALFAAVGLLMLIGCANVSGLILTRMTSTRNEHAIRLALGATRGDLARRWLSEIGLLSLTGGVLGLAGSFFIARAIVLLAPDDLPRLSEVSTNATVATFAFLAVILSALAAVIGPARHAASWSPGEALVESGRMTSGKQTLRIRSWLVVLQIGLAVVLLVAAGLVLRSFANLRHVDLGFDPSGVVTMKFDPQNPTPSHNVWFDQLIERVRALPEVESAGAIYLRPLELGPIGQETSVILEGQPDTPGAADRNPALSYQVATAGYFSAMRIRLRRGRLFDARDVEGAPRVAIVSDGTARRLWPGQEAIGQRLLIPSFVRGDQQKIWRTVVGVVSDVRYRGLDDVRLDVYDAALQAAQPAGNVVVRSSGNLHGLAAAVQAEARRLDPQVLVDGVTTMDAVVTRAMAPWRFSMWAFTVFAAFAFALATVGLFSMVSLDVANRRQEFAVRLALGAERGHVLRSVLFRAGGRAAAGAAVGVFLAVVSTQAIDAILFGVSALDPRTYAGVIGVVLTVVTVASYIPARRASLTDPLPLLRR